MNLNKGMRKKYFKENDVKYFKMRYFYASNSGNRIE